MNRNHENGEKLINSFGSLINPVENNFLFFLQRITGFVRELFC